MAAVRCHGSQGPMLFNRFRSSYQVLGADGFLQAVSLDVIGKDLNELHRRRLAVQRVSRDVFQFGGVRFPRDAGKRADVAFHRPGLQAVFLGNDGVDLLVHRLDVVRPFEDELDRAGQLRAAGIVVGDAEWPQKIGLNQSTPQRYSKTFST